MTGRGAPGPRPRGAPGPPGARPSARCFVGLPLGPRLASTLDALLRDAFLRDATPGGASPGREFRRSRSEAFHLTLAFLGDVPRARLEPLAAALARSLSLSVAPDLVLDRTGSFPDGEHARVLWVGLAERVPGRLAALRSATLAGLAEAGVEPRDAGRFHPHVTVARARGRSARVPAAFAELAPGLAFAPREAVLFETHLGPAGSRHEPLACFPLDGPDGNPGSG